MVPAFVVGAAVYDRVFGLGASNIGFDWIAYPVVGFLPVFLPGKMAPSRQLAIALMCAFLVTFWTAGIMFTIAFSWQAGEYSGGGTAFALISLIITVAGTASALWMVGRKRAGPKVGDLPWAIGTAFALSLAALALILVKGFLT